jgi:hypothetical protein
MKFTPHVVVIIIAMLGYLLYQYVNGGPGNLVSVKAEKDGQKYLVQDLPDKQGAAEMLAEIKAKMDKIKNFYARGEGRGAGGGR